ncbi:LysR family transcriptional regulator [bacterium]|nr:MAG: LysR family transcriptional regulator [bacterium]
MRGGIRGLSGNLNLTLLRTFVRVVEVGHAIAAARSLYLSQSAVSMQLTALSNAVGLPLLERVRGRWVPTAAGKELYESAREVLGLLDRLEQRIADLSLRQTGHVRLVSARIVADLALVPVLAGFTRARPDVRLDISIMGCREAETACSRREADVVLTAEPFDLEASAIYSIGDDEIVALLPLDHPFAVAPAVTVEQLAAGPLVLHGMRSTITALLRSRLGSRFEDLDIVHELPSTGTIVEAVEAGLGCSLLPRLLAERAMRCSRVVALPVDGVDLRRKIIAVTPLGAENEATRVFLAWLCATGDVLSGLDAETLPPARLHGV